MLFSNNSIIFLTWAFRRITFAMSKGKNLADKETENNNKKQLNNKNITIMKTVKFFFAALACLFVSTTVCSAHDYPIPPAQLPAAAQSFLQQHFPGKTIVYAEKDTEFMKVKYEVNLNDGTQVDFDSQGNWDKVDGHDFVTVPAALVPATIQQYVNSTCAGATVTKIDKERYGYDVELSNGMEMKFNHAGAIIGYDD